MKSLALIVLIAFFFGSMFGFAPKKEPKELFVNNKCNMCHSVPKVDIKSKMPTKYPELPNKIAKDTKVDELVKFIKQETNLNGKKHGLKFRGSEDELKSILKWLQEIK